MSRSFSGWMMFVLVMMLTAACGTSEPSVYGVQYPTNYRSTYVHYATVDRKDGVVRELYIHPDSLARLRSGQPLPTGTIIVIEGYDALRDAAGTLLKAPDGRLLKGEMTKPLHVAEKRSDWHDDDFESGQLSGDWNFGSFDAITGKPFVESLTACFNCHNSTQRSDFIWSLPLLFRYARAQTVQYFYCNLSARTACEF